jgi:hypothetical protein
LLHSNFSFTFELLDPETKLTLLALSLFLFTNELGKPTERFDSDFFVEPVLRKKAIKKISREKTLEWLDSGH